MKSEGIFTGGSGGGCVSAALRVARELPAGNFVVAFLPDTGMRYLSKVYSDEWMRERGYAESEVPLTAEDVVAAKHRARQGARADPGRGPTRPCSTRCARCRNRTFRRLPVFEETNIVGTIYEDQILNLALQGKDLRKLVLREVMSKPLPQVPCDAPVERVTHLLSHEGPAVFVVMGEWQLRNPDQVRPDGHHRRVDGTECARLRSRAIATAVTRKQSMKIEDFEQRLENTVLVADGAMGSMLFEAAGAQRCFEELNITQPEAVFRVHRPTSRPARRLSRPIPSARTASSWRRWDWPTGARRSITAA